MRILTLCLLVLVKKFPKYEQNTRKGEKRNEEENDKHCNVRKLQLSVKNTASLNQATASHVSDENGNIVAERNGWNTYFKKLQNIRRGVVLQENSPIYALEIKTPERNLLQTELN